MRVEQSSKNWFKNVCLSLNISEMDGYAVIFILILFMHANIGISLSLKLILVVTLIIGLFIFEKKSRRENAPKVTKDAQSISSIDSSISPEIILCDQLRFASICDCKVTISKVRITEGDSSALNNTTIQKIHNGSLQNSPNAFHRRAFFNIELAHGTQNWNVWRSLSEVVTLKDELLREFPKGCSLYAKVNALSCTIKTIVNSYVLVQLSNPTW